MESYKLDLTGEECRTYLDKMVARNMQPYQPIHLYPDFVAPHKKEGFKRRTKALLKAVDPVGLHVLDLGCAVGWNLFSFVQHGANGVGVDISKSSIHTASCLNKIYNYEDIVQFYCHNVYDYVMETEEHFDCALVLNLLNHIINQKGTDKGWEWMNVISEKADMIICNYYQGISQNPKNLIKYTTYNTCDTIMVGDPYYNNMGRPLYRVWNK